MFINLTTKAQIEILAMKINEVEQSDEISAEEKEVIKKICRQKLKKIQPTNSNSSYQPKK